MTSTTLTLVNVALPDGQTVDIPFAATTGNATIVAATYDPSQLPPNTPPLASLYFHKLQVAENLEISHVASPARISEFLQAFSQEPRRLVLGDQPPAPLDNNNNGVECLYQHLLPANQPSGLTITGFPPRIDQVAPTSPLFQKAYKGQFVHALLLPDGRAPLNAAMPGFTGHKVSVSLDQETMHLEGRWLCLKDLSQAGVNAAVRTRHDKTMQNRKEDGAFDMDGCCVVL